MADSSTGVHLRKVLERHVVSGFVPGIVALVSRRGEVQVEAVGTMSLTSDEPMRRDTIFRISSMTKPVTAAAVLTLVDRGVISLGEPVKRWLPELAGQRVLRSLNSAVDDTVPAERDVTVSDLLSFTGGFGQLYGSPGDYPILQAALQLGLRMGPPDPASQPNQDEWLRRLASLPLMHQPGYQWLYDTGSDLLSVLISRASGLDFATFLQEQLFGPLGMRDTGFSVPPNRLQRLATGYWPDSATGTPVLYDSPEAGQWSRAPAFGSGASGLVSTCDDYLAFATMLLNQGQYQGRQLLSVESTRLMTTDSVSAAQKSRSGDVPLDFSTHGWGMGLAVVTDAGPTWPRGSYGWSGGLGTKWDTDPHQQLIAIVMTQVAMASPDSMQVFEEFASAVQARQP